MLRKSLWLAVALATSVAARAEAITIVEWDLLGEPGSQASTAAEPSPANITGNPLSRGPGLTGNAGTNSLNAAGWSGDAGDYFEFGFSVAPGYKVDLDDLFIGTRSSGTGPGTIGVFTSLDGFTNPVATYNQAPGSNFVNSQSDLSALPDITGNFVARIMAIGNTSANGGTIGGSGTFRVTGFFAGGTFDRNMQLTGTVSAVPEPSTFVLLGLGGLGTALIAVRRRKKTS
jgi:hypothetical protein